MLKRTHWLIVLLLLLAACSTGSTNDAAPAAQAGQELFAKTLIGANPGCITCHSLEPGVKLVGPSMAGIGTRAATTVAGQSAEEYLRTSILQPNEHVVEGFPEGLMPPNWKDNLSQEQVEQLIAYLLTLK